MSRKEIAESCINTEYEWWRRFFRSYTIELTSMAGGRTGREGLVSRNG